MRLIDADKIEYEDMLRPRGNGNYEECQIAYRDQIDDIPIADVRENVRGDWIPQDHNKTNGMMSTAVYYLPQCSVCGHCANYTNFCPNCGADMRARGEQKNE